MQFNIECLYYQKLSNPSKSASKNRSSVALSDLCSRVLKKGSNCMIFLGKTRPLDCPRSNTNADRAVKESGVL